MKLQNLCDVHTHTLFSRHAYSTIRENVEAAKERGLELLGSTDHFSDMLYPDDRMEADYHRHFQYLLCTKDWPDEADGVRLLHGCEVDIVDKNGAFFGDDVPVTRTITADPLPAGRETTLYNWVARHMDYVIASIHGKEFTKDLSAAETTEMYIRALERPEVLMLGHIGRSGLNFDFDEVLKRTKELGKLVEINEHSFGSTFRSEEGGASIDSRCRTIAERCAEWGIPVAVSTDAHNCWNIGRFDKALAMLEEIHFPQELIATRSADAFLEAVHSGVRHH